VYRALSASLAAHAALIVVLLALSATRHPTRVPEIVRPVRLVTYLEPPPAAPARSRAPRPVAPAPAPAPRATERAMLPAEAAPRSSRTAPSEPARVTPVPVAIPKFVIPTRESAPARSVKPAPSPVDTGSALRERLAKRLAAPTAGVQAEEEAAPRIASIPRPEPTAPPRPETAQPSTGATPPAGPVQPVGYFPHAWYLSVLKEEIFARWAPPSDYYLGGAVAALISFRIDRAGNVSRLAVKLGSGYARFDQSALAAVRGLTRVPALPEQYPEDTLDIIIRFQNEK